MSQSAGSDSQPTVGGDERSVCEAPVVRDHTLLRRIGKGSYGDVWLARNSTGAYRAVKIVYRRAFHDVRPFEREFSGIQKFEPVSRSHEGFIDVLQVGINEDEEYFYYVMELGDDESAGQQIDPATYSPKTLSKVLRNRSRLPAAECLILGLALSRALVELHKNRLVHRDIKPSNITFVNGCPKLADIGLVAPLDEARSYVGTEGFIPPEGPGTPQADIYSLGKVLYEIATGHDRHDFPDLPNLNELPDRDAFLEFNEVIIKACNANPQQRYQSAAELHADLLLLENGKSVRRLHILERRWVAFKRTATVSAIIALIAFMIGYEAYSQWSRREETRQRDVGAQIAYGNAALESGDYLGALPHFTTALLLDHPNPSHKRIHELRIGSLLQASPKLTHLWTPTKAEVLDAEFSADGKWAAFAENNGRAHLIDLQTDKLSQPFGAGTFAVCFSPESSSIVTCEGAGCTIWNLPDLHPVRRLDHPQVVYSARFDALGRQLLTSCGDGVARLWDLASRKVLHSWSHDKPLRFAQLSHDGKLVVTCSEDYTARVWSRDGTKPIYVLQHSGWVNGAAFSADDKKLVTACGDHKARVWDLTTGQQLFPELPHLDSVKSAEFSADGTLILTASLDGSARLWRADTFAPVSANPILKHSDRVDHAAFDASGKKVMIAGVDGAVRVWDFSECLKTPRETRTTYSADGSAVAEIADTGVRIRRGATEFNLSRTNIDRVSFSRFGNNFALRERDSDAVEVWSVAQQRLIATIHTTLNNCIPDESGTRLLGFQGKMLQVWTLPTGATNPLVLPHANKIHSVAFNNAGNAVLAVSGNNVLLWDVVSGKWATPPMHFPMASPHAEFSPDGTMIAGCCADGSFAKGYGQVFSATTGKPITSPLYHTDGVLWIAFSADSKRVVTAGEDFNAIIWDIRTGAQVCTPIVHREKVMNATFSPDGTMLATITWDSTLRVWNAETGDPITPGYRCAWANKRSIFTHDGLAVTDKKGFSCLWKFPPSIPAEDDLNDLATLLHAANAKSDVAGTNRPLNARWSRLHSRYSSLFAIDSSVVAESVKETNSGRAKAGGH